jgi:hypothetical protein
LLRKSEQKQAQKPGYSNLVAALLSAAALVLVAVAVSVVVDFADNAVVAVAVAVAVADVFADNAVVAALLAAPFAVVVVVGRECWSRSMRRGAGTTLWIWSFSSMFCCNVSLCACFFVPVCACVPAHDVIASFHALHPLFLLCLCLAHTYNTGARTIGCPSGFRGSTHKSR